MVVDDFEPWRHLAVSALNKRCHSWIVCAASDGPAAVQMAEEIQPYLILLDIALP
jgi:CheY-like chemotaxis protein